MEEGASSAVEGELVSSVLSCPVWCGVVRCGQAHRGSSEIGNVFQQRHRGEGDEVTKEAER